MRACNNKFAALLAAICARIGSRKAKSKAGEIPPFFVSPVVVWGMNKFAALLAAICARIGSRNTKIKAGFLPP